jgi:hypothetical protein
MRIHSFRQSVHHIGRAAVMLGLGLMVVGVCFDSLSTVAIGCVLLCGAAYALIFAKTGSF